MLKRYFLVLHYGIKKREDIELALLHLELGHDCVANQDLANVSQWYYSIKPDKLTFVFYSKEQNQFQYQRIREI